jgi:acetyl esterase/lipase
MRLSLSIVLALVALAARPATSPPGAALHAQAVTPASLEARAVPAPDSIVVRHASSIELRSELRVPATPGLHPVAIVIHGGCWVTKFADTRYMRPMAEALRQAGFATYTIAYRRADEAGGAWPGTFLDIEDAANSLRELAPRYRLDLTRVIATGHSAGAHLALWLAAQPNLPAASAIHRRYPPLPISGVVALDGPGDLLPANPGITRICAGPVLEQVLASAPDANADRWRDASPAAWLPLRVPQVMVRGGLDARMGGFGPREGTMTSYAERARAAGDSTWVVEADLTSHFAMLDPQNPAFSVVLRAMRDVLAMLTPAQVGPRARP